MFVLRVVHTPLYIFDVDSIYCITVLFSHVSVLVSANW